MAENRELAHSFNIRLAPDIVRQLRAEQELLAARFTELRAYDSSPHLAVATKFMGAGDSERFADALAEVLSDERPWELTFADFRASGTGDYIFLHLEPESERRLLELHERVIQATRGIGLEEQTTGRFRSFAYHPHLSIMKLGAEFVPQALPLVVRDFAGLRMRVTAYELTRQEDAREGYARFPVFRSFELCR